MEIKRGQIYRIKTNGDLPEGVSEQFADRPGIIVSNNTGNHFSTVVEIVYLTTAAKKDLPTHCKVHSTGITSTVLCEQIHSISKQRLGDFLGTCSETELNKVDRCMRISLGLSDESEIPVEKDEKQEIIGALQVIKDHCERRGSGCNNCPLSDGENCKIQDDVPLNWEINNEKVWRALL